ncbi:helix-turn-helix domain-containing protein [Chryseobacterium sp. APV1]|uniref:Helix-turn-helix domain-containing protein n=1 Tax=Chryseobacterium urinae TaxID=3058400 RepID=A0ABT8TX69_9FLAO|nr:helix-turn-helix domain-containing protein [Chryseobacterium sp. APV1]MDO3423390.1 helix-turn-helix domain-containing protein [Chryseobacterium sp. APV1]
MSNSFHQFLLLLVNIFPVTIHEHHETINVAKNVVIIVLCSALIGLFLHFRSKQKKQLARIRNILRNQRQAFVADGDFPPENPYKDFINISVEEIHRSENEKDRKKAESPMTSETEAKLLELLDDFEKGTSFTNKNMSLSFLAGELNTNTKYLSHLINRHKNSDFKTYINRLRINYIVDKLINDEKYRQYKISILAEECGFSSHSKFASVFKQITDYSPSVYIKLLYSENQSDMIPFFHENDQKS